jgi:beta-N-acetylhexosaminidase
MWISEDRILVSADLISASRVSNSVTRDPFSVSGDSLGLSRGSAGLSRGSRGLIAAGAALIFCLSFLSAAPAKLDFWLSAAKTPEAESALASGLLDKMSDEEVLGQILMLAYPGDAPGELIFDWIKARALGGVKIFGWNAEDSTKVAKAVAAFQQAAYSTHMAIPLLVATDQEGGWIRHIKGATTVTPGNMAIGASGRPYDAYRSANLIGRELSALGVNMDFAPSVDLATKPRSYIIGPRAFSDDPAAAAALGSAFVRGLADAGILATAKHYPGHGDTESDSHGVLPVIRVDEKTLWDRELLPYRVLSSEGIPAIMSGHLSFPLITGDGAPASLSPYFMTTLLRRRIGFQGLAVTDDLSMNGAVESAGSLSEACIRAVEAGNDLLMISKLLGSDDPAWTRLLSAYRTRPAFKARVREAATRVLVTKLKFLRPRGKAALVPNLESLAARVPDPDAAAFFAAQAYRSVTILRSGSIPFSAPTGSGGRILVASPFKEFFDTALEYYPGAESFHFSYEPAGAAGPAELRAFDRALASADAVILCVANEAGMDFAERAHEAGKRIAIISAQSPAPLARAPWSEASVAVYSYSRESLRAGLAVLAGKAQAQGTLPLRLEK